jgi:hypothetical protein
MVLSRLAAAIRAAYEEELDEQMGACGMQGDDDLCTADVEGAVLNDAWRIFGSWN